MDDAVELGMFDKDLLECFLVGDIDLVEGWSLPAEEFDAIKGDFGGIVQAVNNHHFISMLEEGKGSERANVAGSSVNWH